jgi:hypothetical protein
VFSGGTVPYGGGGTAPVVPVVEYPVVVPVVSYAGVV